MVLKASDLRTGVFVDWCPGCGDFGILSALQMALAELDVEPHKTVLVSGIGQAGKTSHFVKVNGVHTLHGRLLPYAIGIKVANPDLEVIAVGGDGDGLGIGAGHFVNAGRRNVDMTYLLHNNGVYGLTKGQASPTLGLGLQTKSLPRPNINQAVNPIALALVSGYTFIARSYAFDVRHLKETIKQGIQHKGMAFIEILQPCPTYNDINTKDWYEGEDRPDPETGEPRPRIFRLEDRGFDPNVKDGGDEHRKMAAALKESLEMGEQMPIGVFYRNERESTYQERLMHRIPFYLDMPPSRQTLIDNNGRSVANLEALFEDLKT